MDGGISISGSVFMSMSDHAYLVRVLGYVLHENKYVALEYALTSFMASVVLKEQVHP